MESDLIVKRLIGLDVSGEYCGEETVSTLFFRETIPNQNCGKTSACNEYFFVLMCDRIVSSQEIFDR